MTRKVQVAIDGPAGAGKSSVAKAVACAMGYIYIDTGAMYRAVAYRVLKAGLDVDTDAAEIGRLAGQLGFEFRDVNGEQRLFVDEEDVSEVVRTREVGNLSSPVSAIPAVREHLVAAQRAMATAGGTVMEGRDIGTVVLPEAEVKVFLTASPAERARRRLEQLRGRGVERDFDEILADIKARDERDSTRAVAPLKKADDAIEFVTDNMEKDDVVEHLVNIVRRAQENG